ncbi:hypothetical protein K438DRAFT_1965887 [Mycena galopus ATCC 62051]|nr:hypothetical protein K438DRAFT_1965887 [Mycena galopus ATCC 62051]
MVLRLVGWQGTTMWIPPTSKSKCSTLPVEAQFNEPFRLPASIEPLVYFDPNGYGDLGCFTENHMARRYHGPYASPTAFLVAELAGFHVDPPTSARLRELSPRLMKPGLV